MDSVWMVTRHDLSEARTLLDTGAYDDWGNDVLGGVWKVRDSWTSYIATGLDEAIDYMYQQLQDWMVKELNAKVEADPYLYVDGMNRFYVHIEGRDRTGTKVRRFYKAVAYPVHQKIN